MLVKDRQTLSSPSPADKLPSVYIEATTLAQVEYVVDKVSETEVAFYLFLDQLDSGDLLIFGDCFIPEQEVSAGVAKTTSEGEGRMAHLVMDLAEEDKTGETPDIGKLLVHNHSHVMMDCTPSVQDNTNLIQRYNEIKDTVNPPKFALQIIWNQKREHTCQVMKMDTAYHEVYSTDIKIWEGIFEGTLERINKEIETNISLITNIKKKTYNTNLQSTRASTVPSTIYFNKTSYIDPKDSVELWSEDLYAVLGELNIKQKQLLGVIVKDMIFDKTVSQKYIYERLTTIINQITNMKEDTKTRIYSINNETRNYAIFISYTMKKVTLVNTSTGKIIFGDTVNEKTKR